MFGKAQFAKSRKKKPFTSLILTWLSIMYEVCFLDTPPVLIGLKMSHVTKTKIILRRYFYLKDLKVLKVVAIFEYL